MHIVYFIRSIASPERIYIGYSGQESPEMRLKNHNDGCTASTRLHKPWELVTYMVFPNENTARRFEIYCHTGSGKAWANKHVFELIK